MGVNMRVIAGTARSLPLKTPRSLDVRPTTDRIKETLFNILMPNLSDSVFLDVFSGSGSIGIEALSRGAKKAYFIDNAPHSISCIQQNLAFTNLAKRAIVIRQDACAGLLRVHADMPHSCADIIFLDPPYDQGMEEAALKVLSGLSLVGPDTLIVVEASNATDFSYLSKFGFSLVREKKYGSSKHIFIELT